MLLFNLRNVRKVGINAIGGTASDVDALNHAITYLRNGTTDFSIIDNGVFVNLKFVHDTINSWDPSDNTIYWDPSAGKQVKTETGEFGVQSSALMLYHELIHAVHGAGKNHDLAEFLATQEEGRAARELGEPARATYGSTVGSIHISNPTLHTGGGYWKAVASDGSAQSGPKYNSGDNAPELPPSGGASGGGEGVGGVGGGGSHGGTSPGGAGPIGGGEWQNPSAVADLNRDSDGAVNHDILLGGHAIEVSLIGTAVAYVLPI